MSDQFAHDTFEQHAGNFDPVVAAINYLNKYEANIAVVVDTITVADPDFVRKITELFTTWRNELEKQKHILPDDIYQDFERIIDRHEQKKLNP